MQTLDEDEKQVYEYIKSQGGIEQTRLWKEIETSASKTSVIVRNLEEMSIIDREKTVYNGNSTYYLSPAEKKPRDIDYSLLLSGNLLPPFIGDEDAEYDSNKFSQWVLNLSEDYEND